MSTNPRQLCSTPAALAVALLLFFSAGCDSAADITLDASFFVGNWQLESVHDQDGERDRTNEVRVAVDDVRATFHADGRFNLRVLYTEITEQPDQTVAGTYVVAAGQLVLTPDGTTIAIPLSATAEGDNRVALRASATIIDLILGLADVDLELAGTVVLRLARGGPGA